MKNLKARASEWFRNHTALADGVRVWAALFVLLAAERAVWHPDFRAAGFGEGMVFLWSLIPWTLAGMIPLWVLGRHSRWLYVPLVLAGVFFGSVEWFVRLNFDMLLDGDWIGMLLGSSPEELSWFLRHYLGVPTVLVIVLLVAVACVLVRAVSAARNARVSKKTVALALLSACFFIYGTSMSAEGLKVFERLATVHLIADSVRCCRSYAALSQMKARPRLPEGIRACGRDGEVCGVVVLGESAARSHWGLYGYGRDTTPNLSRRRDELVRFDDLVAPAGSTADAMRYIFTTRTVERRDDLRYTMAQALRKCGFDVSLFSNHGRWGVWDGDESFDFAGCEPLTFMCEQDETNAYDEVLLGHLSRALEGPSARKVVFLHLMGSHISCDSRYPHDGAPFDTAAEGHEWALNHYDNSLWYTDKVLEQVIRLLEKCGKPSWMAYLSDHGESPDAQGWRVYTDRDVWDVPFVVWLSDGFKREHPDRVERLKAAKDKPLQSDQLFYGLLDFAGVEGLGMEPCENFLERAFRPRSPRLISDGNAKYEWGRANPKP